MNKERCARSREASYFYFSYHVSRKTEAFSFLNVKRNSCVARQMKKKTYRENLSLRRATRRGFFERHFLSARGREPETLRDDPKPIASRAAK